MADEDLTGMLQRLAAGEAGMERAVFDRVYPELQAMARQQMRAERKGHTLQATALVHEAYMRLVGASSPDVGARAHFFHAAARAMRQVLIEHARGRARIKRGGGRVREPVDLATLASSEDPTALLAVDDALCRLEVQDERLAALVRLRVFAGLGNGEVAEILGVSLRTVERDWAYARAWLYDALE